MNGDSNGLRGSELSDSLRAKCFPMLEVSRETLLDCLRTYDPRSSPAVEEMDKRDSKDLWSWIDSPSPEVLLIDGVEGPSHISWTRDLLLETGAILTDIYSGHEKNSCATITHICPKPMEDRHYSPEVLLQVSMSLS